MENTTHYDLKRWDPEDRVLRTDFNDNWQKLDATLKQNADAVAAEATARQNAISTESSARQSAISNLQTELTKRGKIKIETGTYTGTGVYGRPNAITHTFSAKPVLLIVSCGDSSDLLVAVRPNAKASNYAYLTWTDTGVSWYADGVAAHMNTNNYPYSYIAFLETE